MPPRSKIPCTPRGTPLRPLVSAPPCMLETEASPKKIAHTLETDAPPKQIARLPRTPPPSLQPRSPVEKIPKRLPESGMFQGSSSLAALQKRFQKAHQEAQEAHHQAQPAQETLVVKRGLRRILNTQRRHAKHQHHTDGEVKLLACFATNATVGQRPWMLCYTGISKKTICSYVRHVYQPRISIDPDIERKEKERCI